MSAFVLNPFHSNRQLELPLFLSSLVDHFGGALNESMDVMMHRLNSIQIADKIWDPISLNCSSIDCWLFVNSPINLLTPPLKCKKKWLIFRQPRKIK